MTAKTKPLPIEDAQPLPEVDVLRFLKALRSDPSLLLKLSPEDQQSLTRAAMRADAVRKIPPGVRGAREAAFLHQSRGEPIPDLLQGARPLDPEWVAREERALRDWRPAHPEPIKAALRTLAREPTVRDRAEPAEARTVSTGEAPVAAKAGNDEPSAKKTAEADDARVTQEKTNNKPPADRGEDAPSSVGDPKEEAVAQPDVTQEAEVLREPANPPPLAPAEVLDVLENARAWIGALGAHARSQLERGTYLYERHRSPALPVPRPRRGILEDAVNVRAMTRPVLPLTYRRHLSAMDTEVRRIVQSITTNPVWIAAEHLERTASRRSVFDFPPDRQLCAQYGELSDAMRELRGAESSLARHAKAATRARRALEAHQRRPAWLRSASNFVFDTEQRLAEVAKDASIDVLRLQKEVRECGAQAKQLHTRCIETENARAGEERDLARGERESLEAPLREAIQERFLAMEALENTRARAPAPMRAAPEQQRLAYVDKLIVDAFEFARVRDPAGKMYLLDLVEHRELVPKLTAGAVVRIQRDQHGSRHVVCEPPLEREQPDRARGGQAQAREGVGAAR